MTIPLKKPISYFGNWVSRLGDFLGLAWFLFTRGLSATRLYVAINVILELAGLFWVFTASLCLSLMLAGDRVTTLPLNLQSYLPQANLLQYAIIGLLVSMLAGSIFRFLAVYVINISLPKVETQFYKLTAEKFAAANLNQLGQLDINIAEYLKRDLSMNTRFALMVYRRSVLALVPILSIAALLPIVAYTNPTITLVMGLFFILMMPVYYKINKRSNQITLDMETLTRPAMGQRRHTAEIILDADYDTDNKDRAIACSLSQNNKDIHDFFYLYGARFTTMHATNLTNAIVLFMVIGVLIYFNFRPNINGGDFNVLGFTIIMVVLRQLHTAISRVLLVLNVMSRFYTKLLSLNKIDSQLNSILKKPEDSVSIDKPVDYLSYKHIDTGKPKKFWVSPGNVHVMFDAAPPSRLSILGLKPQTDVKKFNQFITQMSSATLYREDTIFSFTELLKAGHDIDTVIDKYLPIIEVLYNPEDLRRTPKSKLTIKELLQSSLGEGISYIPPSMFRVYEAVIDLVRRVSTSDSAVVFLDARCLGRLREPYVEQTLSILKTTGKLVFIVLSKQTHQDIGLNPKHPVIVCGSPRADGFIEYEHILRIVKEKIPATGFLDDEESQEL